VQQLLRLLDLVRRDLGAEDVRAEVGGRDPEGDDVLWCALDNGFRIVARFSGAVPDRERLLERLRLLAASFTGAGPAAGSWSTLSHELASRRLDDELEVLVDRSGAVRAVVLDVDSPVIWGSSGMLRGDEGVDTAIETAAAVETATAAGIDLAELLRLDPSDARAKLEAGGVDARTALQLSRAVERIRQESRRSEPTWRYYLLTCRAIAAVRASTAERSATSQLAEIVRHDGWSYLVRGFAGIYCLLLVFEGAFSELHAEGAVVHALPVIERMVLALPPIDPPPKRKEGKVIRLRR